MEAFPVHTGKKENCMPNTASNYWTVLYWTLFAGGLSVGLLAAVGNVVLWASVDAIVASTIAATLMVGAGILKFKLTGLQSCMVSLSLRGQSLLLCILALDPYFGILGTTSEPFRLLVIWGGLCLSLALVWKTQIGPVYSALMFKAIKAGRILPFLVYNWRVVRCRRYDSWHPCFPAFFVFALANTMVGTTLAACLIFVGMGLYLESCWRWAAYEVPDSPEAWAWVVDCGLLTMVSAIIVFS